MYRNPDAEGSNIKQTDFEKSAQAMTPGAGTRERAALIGGDAGGPDRDLADLKAELRVLAEVEANQSKRNLVLMRQLREASDALEELRSGLGVGRLIDEVADLKARLQIQEHAFAGRIAALEEELRAGRTQKADLQTRQQADDQRIMALEAELAAERGATADLRARQRALKARIATLEKDLRAARTQRANLQKRVQELVNSTSWKITRPIRRLKDMFRRR